MNEFVRDYVMVYGFDVGKGFEVLILGSEMFGVVAKIHVKWFVFELRFNVGAPSCGDLGYVLFDVW